MNAASSSAECKVVIVDDHPIFREQLAHMLSRDLHLSVCGEADNVDEAASVIEDVNPDIAIVGLSLKDSNGLDLIQVIKARGIKTRVLILSMHDEPKDAERALQAGAHGYITKGDDASEIRASVQEVLTGGIYLSPLIARRLLHCVRGAEMEPRAKGLASLSDRELETLGLLGAGLTSREIADRLGVDEVTINNYRFRMRCKLGLGSASELSSYAANWVKKQAKAWAEL